eukprot:8340424-Alexandrium_andersonii.AAC.1
MAGVLNYVNEPSQQPHPRPLDIHTTGIGPERGGRCFAKCARQHRGARGTPGRARALERGVSLCIGRARLGARA